MTGLPDNEAHDYDAILVVSFGGPEGPDDVMPFLDNVLEGLKIPPPVKGRIAKRYDRFGGVSPINAHTRAFIEALEQELEAFGPKLPVYWGNRNWHPFLTDTMEQMAADGVKNVIAYVTSTFSSYSGCRKYREDLYRASQGVENAPRIDKLRAGYNHPGFIEAVAARVSEARAKAGEDAAVLFTAHSLPLSMAKHTDYQAQLLDACGLVANAIGLDAWELVYQSNNASYGEPWLEPDIADALEDVKQAGHARVVVVPIGFVCDHMEVVLDLDVEAQEKAAELGLEMVRAGTVGTHPAYIAMVRELIEERMRAKPERRFLGARGPQPDICGADCCLSGKPGDPKPSLCGVEA